MNLPPDFISNIQGAFGEDGKKFLEALPSLIEETSKKWGLTDIQPVPNLSYNFVAFADRGEENVILKMGVLNRELTSEMAALSLFNGDGACRLLECDEERGFLLLERLSPGRMLSELKDDDERTRIAAEVMSKLWRDINLESEGHVPRSGMPSLQERAPALHKFIQLADWFDGLKKIRLHFGGGTGPIPKELLERVEAFLPELFGDKNIKLMHGDFHHFNVLSSERGWLAIDPKGVIGPVGYEVGPLMINPWNSISDRVSFKVRAERRVSILSERFGWAREKIIKWATAHAVLSAWWGVEDNTGWEYALSCAEIFSEIKWYRQNRRSK